ncbi:sigma-70 family RNA polymerase sigma factor [Delftia acidovorans]|uniref:sigma-70 family RNA polymerase sigma factor n=1 Tax=Delftia acidovorans TaxID=80866 RepID=UPI0028E782B6|nr:sigma-70 family RNA polymerase sigma factor [Delftia acidovorans]
MPAAPAALHQEVDTLYRVHHGWLQGWLRRRLGNSTEAADLAQDTFMRLLTRSEPIAAREPRAFLTAVAQGVVANFMRRRQIEEAYLATLAHLPEPQVPGPETRAILLETLVELDRRLDTLAPPVRRAFLLSQLEGMKQADIAAELQLSLATVQRHIAKAAHCCFFGG